MAATFLIERTWDGVPIGPEEQVRVGVEMLAGGIVIVIDAPWWGDPRPAAAPGPCDRLWEFEVVELFVAEMAVDDSAGSNAPSPRPSPTRGEGVVRYTEIEMGPQGHQLVLRFLGTRNAVDRALLIEYSATIRGSRWQGRAFVPFELLPPQPWTANAFALHGQAASRRYLAAAPLPGPRPDFHQPERFPPFATFTPATSSR